MIVFSAQELEQLKAMHCWLAEFDMPPTGIASLEQPQPGALHFIDGKRTSLAIPQLPKGAGLLLPAGVTDPDGICTVHVESPKAAVGRLLQDLRRLRTASEQLRERNGAWVAADVSVPDGCRILPGAVIHSGVSIEIGVEIGAGVVLHDGVRIGQGCRIHSGARVGEDGFGYAFLPGGKSFQLPHLGGVVIGDGVDIGPNSVVCSGTIEPTFIGPDCRIDGMVYVGHNARIGRTSWVIAGSVVGGSSVVGENVWINTSAMVRSKVRIGNYAVIGAGAVVMKDVPEHAVVMGDIAGEIGARLRRNAALDRMVREDKNES